jgi:hypothetical protein
MRPQAKLQNVMLVEALVTIGMFRIRLLAAVAALPSGRMPVQSALIQFVAQLEPIPMERHGPPTTR